MTRLTDSQVIEAVRLYGSGLSFSAVGKMMGVSGTAIGNMLKRRGIPTRTVSQARRTIQCDHHYFDSPIDEARAYWIGFILADGYVTEKRYGQTRRLAIRLADADRGHLEKFKAAIGSGHKIISVTGSDNSESSCQFSVSSAEMVESLARYGVVPRKSAKQTVPDRIPEGMLAHFYRGYFDGNGGICRSKSSKWQISNCASHEFLDQFNSWLHSQLDGHHASIKHYDGIHRSAWAGTHRCLEILSTMYDGASIFLDRKMALYKELRSDAKASSRGPYNRW